MKTGIYPGSFDPITLGHMDVIRRAAKLVDELTIGVLVNHRKQCLFSAEERVSIIEEVTKEIPNIKVRAFEGLLADYAREHHINVVFRGLRAMTDFEYELQMAQFNHKLNPDIDTLFLTTNVEYSYLSSSAVKEVAVFSGDISNFVPECIIDRVIDKCKEEQNESIKN